MQPLLTAKETWRLLSGARTASVIEKGLQGMLRLLSQKLLGTIEKTNAMCNGKDPENSEHAHWARRRRAGILARGTRFFAYPWLYPRQGPHPERVSRIPRTRPGVRTLMPHSFQGYAKNAYPG